MQWLILTHTAHQVLQSISFMSMIHSRNNLTAMAISHTDMIAIVPLQIIVVTRNHATEMTGIDNDPIIQGIVVTTKTSLFSSVYNTILKYI
jgi:hypothetical protein